MKLIKDINVRMMMIASAVIVCLSWYRVIMANTMAVDGFGLNGSGAVILFTLFILSLLTFGIGYFRFWKQHASGQESVRPVVYLLILIFLPMAPMLSSDVFSYLTFGDTSNKGIDVFTDPNHLFLSSYYSYVSPLYLHIPCVYGPVALVLFKIPAWLGNSNVLQAWMVYKIIILFFAVVFVELAFKVNAILKQSVQPLLFLLLNPVFLMQGVGQVHPDLIASTFVLAAFYFLLTDMWYIAFILVIIAATVKLNYILMFPFIWGGAFFMSKGKEAVTRAIVGPIISILTLLLIYAPFYSSLDTIRQPFLYQFMQTPTKSIAQVLGELSYFMYTVIGHNVQELSDNLNNPHYVPPHLIIMWKVATKIAQILALLTSAYILWKFIKGAWTISRWVKVYVRLLLVFLLVYTHIFYSWYLMMFLPFVWGIENEADIKWLIVLTGIVQIQDLTVALNRETTVRMAAIIISYLCIIVYVWRYKTFFIDFEPTNTAIKDIPGDAVPVEGDYVQ